MNLHKGEILKAAIEESGLTITGIIDKLKKNYKHIKCSRTRLYHLFKEPEIDDNFMLIIGKLIYHDFSEELPDLAKNNNLNILEDLKPKYHVEPKTELFLIRKEHAKLQKVYIELLSFLTKVANQNNDVELKKEIESFLNRTDQ